MTTLHGSNLSETVERQSLQLKYVPFRQRPYCVERTRSHSNSEVKQRKARLVPGWGTAREALRVPLAFHRKLYQMRSENLRRIFAPYNVVTANASS